MVPADYSLDRVIVMAPEYLKELSKLLDQTSEDTIHTYFLWKAIQAYAGYVEADAIEPYRRFSNELQGKVTCFDYFLCLVLTTLVGSRLETRTVENMCRTRR